VRVDSNVVLTRDPYPQPFYTYGIQSYGPEDILSHNLIITPASHRFIGVLVHTDSWIESNTIIPRQVVRQSYESGNRAVGIEIGNGSTGSTSVANRTYGMDVGIGPEPYQYLSLHRVITHYSTNDVLGVDPQGLTEDSLP
jgi:hypothetical protein